MKKIAITGAGGQIAYSLIFRIANGELFGGEEIVLHLIDIPLMLPQVRGLVMEIEDGAFPAVREIKMGSNLDELFRDIDLAILIGGKPREAGMERKDLLLSNGVIFSEQGKALERVAKRDVLVFVVANPCNTNCLIALHQAPSLNPKNFHAMTRLDQNRAVSAIAKKAKVGVKSVSPIIIWGNHSTTQVPDFFHGTINGQPIQEIIEDDVWLRTTFFSFLQKRGAEIIQARGKSSAASAAQGILDGLKSLYNTGNIFSSGVYSAQNQYHIDPDLIFSFPCQFIEGKGVEIIKDWDLPPFLGSKLKETEVELLEERDAIRHFLD